MTDISETAHVAKIAQPYIDTTKPGDVISVGPSAHNQPGWWTVFRNGRPIHHMTDEDYAEKLAAAIRNDERPDDAPVAECPFCSSI